MSSLPFSWLFACRAEYECFQIELAKNYGVPEWREDIKKVMMKAGIDNKAMVFLFSDTQVRNRPVRPAPPPPPPRPPPPPPPLFFSASNQFGCPEIFINNITNRRLG